MSRNQRIGLVVAALAVAVLAFVLVQPADDDEAAENSGTTAAQTETEQAGGATDTEPQATEAEEPPPPPPEPEVARIRIEGGAVAGGPQDIEVEQGDTVRIVVTADAEDEIHLHGYDITRVAAPGRPARFRFQADAEGAFEMESHVAADAGRDPLVARLVVQPS
jgi:FtsP/CotA-like multicopper oxidase with cupredoxin domain